MLTAGLRSAEEAGVNVGVRLPGRGALSVALAVAIVPCLAAASAGPPVSAAGSAAGTAGPAWAGSTAPVTALNPAPTAPNGDGVVLGSVSCPATGSCVAVGHYASQAPGTVPLAESLSGGTWTATAPPTAGLNPPAGLGAALTKVSCPAAGSCVALGTYDIASVGMQTVIETLSGGSWTAATAPAPAPANTVDLQALSCPAVGSCAAAGYYLDPSGREDGLVVTLAGGAWSATAAPAGGLNPPPSANSVAIVHLDGVSCPAVGSCVAVGDYRDTSNNEDWFAETLSGGAWSPATIPMTGLVPTGLSVDSFTGISCPAAGSCAATGTYADASGQATSQNGIEHG